MGDLLTETTIDAVTKRLGEPSWLAELRVKALARHRELPWPHPSDDIWRRTDVSQLDPAKGCSLAGPTLLEGSVAFTDEQLAALGHPLGGEHLLVRVNGQWVGERPRLAGLVVEDLAQTARTQPEPIRRLLATNGLTPAEEKLASLNAAFHHDDVVVRVAPNTEQAIPVRLVHVLSVAPHQAVFPLTLITVGSGSSLTLIDEYASVGAADGPHLAHGRIELVLEQNTRVHYVRLQRWGRGAREFLLQRASLAEGAQLTMANLYLGSALSKTHVIARFDGPHASSQLYGFVFGQRAQHVDQHTLQDHVAPHTSSDLHVRAALQDHSRLIYTGLIRIGKEATQTQAYQANHNLLLSKDAQAETIPMLEILADDVQCKHGDSIGPIDEEQLFYLMSRGMPREAAERLIVMGFVEPSILQVPFEPLQERLRAEIEGELHY